MVGFPHSCNFWAPSPCNLGFGWIHVDPKSGFIFRPPFWWIPRSLPNLKSLWLVPASASASRTVRPFVVTSCAEDKTLINDWADVREICELCPNLEWLSLSRTRLDTRLATGWAGRQLDLVGLGMMHALKGSRGLVRMVRMVRNCSEWSENCQNDQNGSEWFL